MSEDIRVPVQLEFEKGSLSSSAEMEKTFAKLEALINKINVAMNKTEKSTAQLNILNQKNIGEYGEIVNVVDKVKNKLETVTVQLKNSVGVITEIKASADRTEKEFADIDSRIINIAKNEKKALQEFNKTWELARKQNQEFAKTEVYLRKEAAQLEKINSIAAQQRLNGFLGIKSPSELSGSQRISAETMYTKMFDTIQNKAVKTEVYVREMNEQLAKTKLITSQQNWNNILGIKSSTGLSGSDYASQQRMYDKLFNAKSTGKTGIGKFTGDLVHNIAKMGEWAIAAAVLYGSLHLLQQAFQDVIAVETELVNIRKVLPNGSDMSPFLPGAEKTAQAYGTALTDVLKAMQSWARQYKETNTIIQLTNTSMMAAAVTDITLESSYKLLSSTMAQFKMRVSESGHVIDSWNELSNNMRVSAQDLAEGLSKTGAAAKLMGVDFDRANGMIGTMVEVLGTTGSQAGTVLSRMFARVHTKTAVEELKSVNINAFQPMSKTLDQLGLNWKSYSKSEQEAIAKSLGGSHHWQKLAALFDNYDRVIQATIMSYTSFGSAQSELDNALSTFNKKVEQLQAVWQSFTVNLLNDTLPSLKEIVDTTKNVITAMDTLRGKLKQFTGQTPFGALDKWFKGMINLSTGGILDPITKIAELINKKSTGGIKQVVADTKTEMVSLQKALDGFKYTETIYDGLITKLKGLKKNTSEYASTLRTIKTIKDQVNIAVKNNSEALNKNHIAITRSNEAREDTKNKIKALEQLMKTEQITIYEEALTQINAQIKKLTTDKEYTLSMIKLSEERLKQWNKETTAIGKAKLFLLAFTDKNLWNMMGKSISQMWNGQGSFGERVGLMLKGIGDAFEASFNPKAVVDRLNADVSKIDSTINKLQYEKNGILRDQALLGQTDYGDDDGDGNDGDDKKHKPNINTEILDISAEKMRQLISMAQDYSNRLLKANPNISTSQYTFMTQDTKETFSKDAKGNPLTLVPEAVSNVMQQLKIGEKVANQIDEFSAKIANQSAESLNRTNDIINDSANQLQQSSEAFTTAFDNMIEKSNKLPEFLTGNALTGLLDQNIKSSEQQLNKLDKSYNDLLTDWNQLNNNLNAKQSELKNNPEDKLLSAQIDALKKAMDLNDGQRAEVLAEITKWINNTNDLTGAKTHWSQIIEMINQTVKPAYDDLQKATKTGSEFDIAQANDTYNNALENAKIQIDNMANQTKYTAVASEYLAAALLNVKSTSEQMDLIMKKAFLDDSAIDIFSNYDAVASDFFGKESSYKDLENRFGMNIEPTLEQLEQFSRQMIFIAATATDQGDIDQAIENLRKLNDQIKKLTKEKISSNFFKDLFKGKSLSESIANAFSTAVQPTLDILADTLGDFFANIRKNGEDENRNFSFANLFNSDSWSNLKDTVLSGDSLMALGGLAGNYLSASSPSNSTGSIIGGALTGGSAGFQAYGVYGAIAGAIIGAIGGAFGGGGSKYVRYEPDELDTHESYDDYLSADANARRKNFQINDEEWDKVLKGWDDYTRSLSASISDIASNITSAFSADNYIGFLQSWNQSLYEQTRTALIKGFMAQEAYQGLYKTLSDTISYAVLDGSLSDEEKLAIKNAGNNIATQMKPLYDALNSLEDMFVGGSGSSSSSSGNYTAGSSSPIVYNNYITISAQAFAGNEDEARSFALLMRDYIVAEEQRG